MTRDDNRDPFADCATADEAKRRYRNLSKTMHPDRGGDGQAFARLGDQYSERLRALERAARRRGDLAAAMEAARAVAQAVGRMAPTSATTLRGVAEAVETVAGGLAKMLGGQA